ncbi:MAG TPA: 50S ribosomal protein L9 [Caulobacterales bacterium]|nr:50S ribosomal protein L9 [Caulobacterales bacterium]
MQIVLLERVENLGAIGDVVKVKDGYARNFLLPKHKALRATEANLKKFEAQRADLEKRNAAARAEAEKSGKAFDGKSFVLLRQAGETGHLYGSVAARDIVDAAAAEKIELPRSGVVLDKPIKLLGVYDVKVRLHPEVTITVKLNVARSADEAERQARGENVIAAAAADQRVLDDKQAKTLAAIANERPPGDA